MMGLFQSLFTKTFAHGIHPPTSKGQTHQLPIRRMPFSDLITVPLSQHFGAPSKPLVHKGQEVVRGEPIAEADGFMSVPMHAPVTGVVVGVELTPTAKGPKTEAIIIKTHPSASQKVMYGSEYDWQNANAEDLIHEIQNTGMVGLGGAGFPSHVKMQVPEDHQIDTLVINGCECEPYLTTDHRLMLEMTDSLLLGIRIALKICGAKKAIIGIEDNKMDAVAAIRERLDKSDPISVGVVKTKYPQGSEKLLITALLGREVPSGGLPFQVGVVVNNVATLAQLGELIPERQGLIERVVTIAGPGVAKPGNYMVPLGTPLRFALEHAGYFGDASRLVLGGPMMGNTAASLDVPITKPVSGILVLEPTESNSEQQKIYPCIHCSHCLEACPVNLNPSQLGRLAAKREYEVMASQYHLNDCFECGSCSYVCPSNIPLVQYFRIAKSVNRERSS
ncbi:electron transport complex subunit RsxC [Candidatus Venteria ishoeyi]|uniref:Ion-translocating oxidoreductase complex subunit C n=1 Tax=Candidatus Venteria ishoeyi TaxID=1899563 RepID=A0A1H6FDP3_9GAMM|nr:electron transport complex subunit RsxC [Candidatus Venteria ishoeyi]MDM8544967.1 electron transport complex subunit RsxC [Candidatus Venteria ishoeyi]SEH07773.1 Electron transport complex protein RnfC [Candidatus Venteria ishoeyi]